MRYLVLKNTLVTNMHQHQQEIEFMLMVSLCRACIASR